MLHKAQYIDSHRKEVAHTCEGRVLATLFYEPSTRTRLSFETAMLRLGGRLPAVLIFLLCFHFLNCQFNTVIYCFTEHIAIAHIVTAPLLINVIKRGFQLV